MSQYKKLRGETDKQYEKRTSILKSQRNARRRKRKRVEEAIKAARKRDLEELEAKKVKRSRKLRQKRLRAKQYRASRVRADRSPEALRAKRDQDEKEFMEFLDNELDRIKKETSDD